MNSVDCPLLSGASLLESLAVTVGPRVALGHFPGSVASEEVGIDGIATIKAILNGKKVLLVVVSTVLLPCA